MKVQGRLKALSPRAYREMVAERKFVGIPSTGPKRVDAFEQRLGYADGMTPTTRRKIDQLQNYLSGIEFTTSDRSSLIAQLLALNPRAKPAKPISENDPYLGKAVREVKALKAQHRSRLG